MNPRTARQFLDAYEAANGEESLYSRPPLALAIELMDGYDLSNPATLYDPAVLVYPAGDPVISAALVRSGARQRGPLTWQIGTGEENNAAGVLNSLLRHARRRDVYGHYDIAAPRGGRGPRGYKDLSRTYYARDGLTRAVTGWNDLRAAVAQYPATEWQGGPTRGLISVVAAGTSMWVRAWPWHLEIPEELREEIGEANLELRVPGGAPKAPVPLRAAAAVAVCEWAVSAGLEIVSPSGENILAELRRKLAHVVVGWTRPGRPAQAFLSVGARVALDGKVRRSLVQTSDKDSTYITCNQIGNEHHTHNAQCHENLARASRIGMVDSLKLARLRNVGVPCVLHPSVADITDLVAATPVDDERLRVPQRLAVGKHLATSVGYANLSDPGAGKTIMSLDAMRRRAERFAEDPSRIGAGYRGLVVADAPVRDQFAGEACDWFPKANVTVITSSSQFEDLRNTLRTAGDKPILVVTSYALASVVADTVTTVDPSERLKKLFYDAAESETDEYGNEIVAEPVDVDEAVEPDSVAPVAEAPGTDETIEVPIPTNLLELLAMELAQPAPETKAHALLMTKWDDIIADEAACLRNNTSKQAKAMWLLRENAQVAVALTGTPVNRGIDDLGRIIAWTRNDRHMFHGAKLSDEFDLSNPDDVKELYRAIGPVVFRMSEDEFADELPPMADPIIIRLTPSLAEKRLSHAARNELKRQYEELLALIQEYESTNPDDPELPDIRTSLIAARGAVLGGGQLARMAASDPAALLTSESAGVALLAGQGLLAEATAQPGTKRLAAVSMCVERVARGERILVFTEFATVARGLIADLASAGLRVGQILGGGGKRRDEDRKAFARGELDVLVSTSAGERGLNLQTATTLIHYDLSWLPASIIQRTGRIKRIGSTAKQLQVIFLVMEGTIEERVVAIVAARSIMMTSAMAGATGKNVTKNSFGKDFAGLINIANGLELTGRDATLLEVTQAILED